MNPHPDPRATNPVPDEAYYRRNEMTRRWGTLLLVVGVVWLVFELTTRGSIFGVGMGFVERSSPLPEQRYRAERVVISGVNDRIELVGSSGSEVVLAANRRGYGWNGSTAERAAENLEVVVEQHDGLLTIDVRRPPSVGSFLGRRPAADLRLSLPEGVAAEVVLTSGNIMMHNLQSDLVLQTISGAMSSQTTLGSFNATTTSGAIRVRNHQGPFQAQSMSGAIRAEGQLEDVQVNSVSGAIQLEGSNGPLALNTISGNITINDAHAARLDIDTTSGSIQVVAALEPAAENRINTISGGVSIRLITPEDLRLVATTVSGDLSTNLLLNERVAERRQLIGVLGSGTTQLTVSSTSGAIRITGP
ncbi:DUF4097 family beta strand repeat-containing protein [Candidatus Viridilinea mediisalina]|uniref:DUF4097 domain-containing protein n=1 Tax=Candidatus Viridilinea mediisalina TaxID=2024553 RepID=A0A2A6RJ87_9CHLR|nr:DUF4097 family beta strand repeat-containing protein [Candidatus Viridilinea mediisalina]PDW02956.1 hypothetical protein CJ255_11295 [Candidatus Viridilinea mediisalina]